MGDLEHIDHLYSAVEIRWGGSVKYSSNPENVFQAMQIARLAPRNTIQAVQTMYTMGLSALRC